MEQFTRSPTISVSADACTHEGELTHIPQCRQFWGGTCLSNYKKNRVLRIFWSTGMMNGHSYWKIFCKGFQPFSDMVNSKKFHCIKVTLSLLLCGIISSCNLFQNLLHTFSHHLHEQTLFQRVSHIWHSDTKNNMAEWVIAYCTSTDAEVEATWGLLGMNVSAYNV
jgi:hypothetical protein